MMQFVVFEGINDNHEGISQRKQLAGLIVRFLLSVVPSYQVSFACVDFSIKNICLRNKSTVARFNTVDMQTIRVITKKNSHSYCTDWWQTYDPNNLPCTFPCKLASWTPRAHQQP